MASCEQASADQQEALAAAIAAETRYMRDESCHKWVLEDLALEFQLPMETINDVVGSGDSFDFLCDHITGDLLERRNVLHEYFTRRLRGYLAQQQAHHKTT